MRYVIKKGDTLSGIASALTIGGSSYAIAIANYNNISNPNKIYAGQSITIPDNWLKGYDPTTINPIGIKQPTIASSGGQLVVNSNPSVATPTQPIATAPAQNPSSGIMGMLKNPIVLIGIAAIMYAMFSGKKKDDLNDGE